MRALSLGWGVQSTTLAVMAALKDIEPLVAIHADTSHERIGTYHFAAQMTPWLQERNVQVVTVSAQDSIRIGQQRGVFIPAFGSDGGMLPRQCTERWKIAPIRRWLQKNRDGAMVDLLMGISLDEWQRMRESDVKYCRNVYPLVDMRMTRADCVRYLTDHGLEVPPKSACCFCPYHSARGWRDVKSVEVDWEHAAHVDECIRNLCPPRQLFVHSDRRPLREVDLRTEQEKGQMDMFADECAGVCFV